MTDKQAKRLEVRGVDVRIECTGTPTFTAPTASDACNGATVNLLTSTTTGNACARVITQTWEIGRASSRERAKISEVTVLLKKKEPTIGAAGADAKKK